MAMWPAFFYSEMYYQALQVEMEKDIAAFRKVIEEEDHFKTTGNPRAASMIGRNKGIT